MPAASDVHLPDDEMVGNGRCRDRVETPPGGSPPKVRRAEGDQGSAVSPELLRTLLAEQQAAILTAQRTAIKDAVDEAMQKAEARQHAKLAKVEGKTATRTDWTRSRATWKPSRRSWQTSTTEPRRRRHPLPATPGGDGRNKNTLVIGGFPRDTRRKAIVDAVDKALRKLDLMQLTDLEPFTTRPRSSFALLRFERRKDEAEDQLRTRLHSVLNGIVRGKIMVPHQDRPLWAGLSKTKPERERAQHCGAVREAIRYFNSGALDLADFDYNTGTSIMGWRLAGLLGYREGSC